MECWTRLLLYGTYDGFSRSTDGDNNIIMILDNGERVEIPNHFVKNASDFVEKNKIKLKDIIARMEGLNGLTRYKAGYEQGKLEGEWVGQQLKDADKIRQELNRPTVPQFMADWINYCKNTNVTLVRALLVEKLDFYNHANQEDFAKLKEFLKVENNQELFARAWLDGYEVEKEKKYTVKLKNTDDYLVKTAADDYRFYSNIYTQSRKHTRKELEEAGFNWVFDCEGIEIKEVEE